MKKINHQAHQGHQEKSLGALGGLGGSTLDLSRFHAVIFDFDGVIVDSETRQADTWTQVGRELQIPSFSVHVSQTAGRADLLVAAELFPPPHDVERCLKRKWEIDLELETTGQIVPIPSAVDLLRRLHPTHRLAIASSNWQHRIESWLTGHDLIQLFTAIVGKREGVKTKPSPDLYLRALSLLNLDPTQVCAIEDSLTGITASKAAGLFTIQLHHLYMAKCPEADAHVKSLNDFLQDLRPAPKTP